jgi:hypothetical protein
METPPRKGAANAADGFGTPPRGATAGYGTPVRGGPAAPPPVREEYQSRTIDPKLFETKILGLHLERDEKDAILNKYNQALHANSLLDEYKTPDGYKKFVQVYAEIIHKLRPKSDIKFVLKPEFRASINAQIRAREEAKRSTGGRRRRGNYKRTNRNRNSKSKSKGKSNRHARTRKN